MEIPSKPDTSIHSWPDIGPTSQTVGQHWSNIGLICRVCWVRRKETKIRLSMTGCITGGSVALKGSDEALNDDGKPLKGIGVTLEGDEEAVKGNGYPDSNVMVGHRWPTTKGHRLLIADGPLAIFFADDGPPMVHQWQIPPFDCRLHATGGPLVFFCC